MFERGSELKLHWCWQRRGVAFDRCGLMSWSVHNKWVNTMDHVEQSQSSAASRFQRHQNRQSSRADRLIFTLIARENLPSLKASAAGVSPLDARMETYMNDPRITMFMLPMPLSQRTTSVWSSDRVMWWLKEIRQIRKRGRRRESRGLKNHVLKS